MSGLRATHIAAILFCAGLLAPGDTQAAPLDPAFQRFAADRKAQGETVSLRQHLRRDFSGDGKAEVLALFTGHYAGGNGSVQHLVLFAGGDKGLQEVDRLSRDDLPEEGAGYAPILDRMRLQGTTLLLNVRVFTADDPHCCPSKEATWRFRVTGKILRRLGER